MMAKGVGVKDKHKDYLDYIEKWQRCRDVVSGQDAVHAATVKYLPMLVDQEYEDYLAYVKRAPFYNATWRTIAGFVGMMFRKPPILEVPAKLEALLEDVTMSGINFQSFAKDCATEDLEVSRVGILVDHPLQVTNADGSPVSIAQAEAQGLRPSMQQYKAEAIINWKYEFINNKNTLVQVRLLEEYTEEVTEFKVEHKLRIRVLDLIDGKYRMRVFAEDTEEQIGEDVYPLMNNKNLDFIPFFIIGPDGTDGRIDEPVLIDLVDLNLKHYQVGADYEHGCHMTGLPTPVISGYANQFDEVTGAKVAPKFYIGSTMAWVFPDPNAKAEFLEFTGQGLSALEKNLERKEAQMAAIGARMLAPEKSGVEAAQTLAMRHSGEYSILAAIAIAVSEGLTKALEVFAQWAGVNGEVKYEINREFIPIIADSALLTQLMALVMGGHMDEESLFDWLKRADLVDPELTFEEMQKRIDENPPAPPLAPIGHNGGPALDENGDPVKDPKTEPKPKDPVE